MLRGRVPTGRCRTCNACDEGSIPFGFHHVFFRGVVQQVEHTALNGRGLLVRIQPPLRALNFGAVFQRQDAALAMRAVRVRLPSAPPFVCSRIRLGTFVDCRSTLGECNPRRGRVCFQIRLVTFADCLSAQGECDPRWKRPCTRRQASKGPRLQSAYTSVQIRASAPSNRGQLT